MRAGPPGMHTAKVTNPQLSLKRPGPGKVGPWVLKENVTEDTGLELGLEELGSQVGCSPWGC